MLRAYVPVSSSRVPPVTLSLNFSIFMYSIFFSRQTRLLLCLLPTHSYCSRISFFILLRNFTISYRHHTHRHTKRVVCRPALERKIAGDLEAVCDKVRVWHAAARWSFAGAVCYVVLLFGVNFRSCERDRTGEKSRKTRHSRQHTAGADYCCRRGLFDPPNKTKRDVCLVVYLTQ